MASAAEKTVFNLGGGVKRLLIVLAVINGLSMGATAWTWIDLQMTGPAYVVAEAELDRVIMKPRPWAFACETAPEGATACYEKADPDYHRDDEIRGRAYELKARFEGLFERLRFLQMLTVIVLSISAASLVLVWVLSGFAVRQKVPPTATAGPLRQTDSADTHPPADTEG